MTEENISQGFRLKNIDEIRKDFIEEKGQNELMSNKHKKVGTTLNYIYFSFYSCWVYLHFCFCFFSQYSYRSYEFCNRIKNFRNNCRN